MELTDVLNVFRKKADIHAGIREYRSQRRAMLVDVRDKNEFAAGHIEGSRNIPLSQISKTTSAIHDKSMPIYVYCKTGSRSRKAASELEKMGYTNVKNIGGIDDFKGRLVK